MTLFTHEPHPARVRFGEGAQEALADEIDRLRLERVILVASPRLAEAARARLGSRVVDAIAGSVMHVPLEVADAACAAAERARADGLAALGGGSTVGLAKAIALRLGLPIVAVPTTFAGSEMTSVWGLTSGGLKRTGRDERVRPRTVLYDPDLLRTLPPATAGPSGLNAIAHALEALYAPDADPITLLLAEESVRAMAESLPQLVAGEGGSGDAAAAGAARRGALYGAWLGGVCLDRSIMGIHHRLCHVLGGSFDLPHAAVHAVLLPQVAAFNRAAAPEAMRRLGRALSAADGPAALWELGARVGAPRSLAEIGMKASDLDRAAELATSQPFRNPRPVDRPAIRALLEEAFAGHAPAP